MPNRILREGILTSSAVTRLGWADLPDPRDMQTEAEVLVVRAMLPRATAGDELQSYKWALSCRLRAIRMKGAGHLSQSLVRDLIQAAGDTCPVCAGDMRYWVGRRWPTIDHIVALANGGSNEAGNLRVVCNRCNSRKAHRAD